MAYSKKIYRFKDSNEYEYTYAGKYGAKGEKRAKKTKPTKEQIKRQNQKNKEIRYRRLIKANFSQGDLWCCLKYPQGYRIPIEEVKKDLKKFLKMLRKNYKDKHQELKFIYRMEIGSRGGIHIHILVNRIWHTQTDLILLKAWEEVLRRRKITKKRASGLLDYKSIYDSGGYQSLAEYITKQPAEDSEEYKQLSLFAPVQQKILLSVSSSRNLIRPEPQKKEIKHWTMRHILEDGPKPSKGYYIDKESVVCGINPYTGMSYLKYTEVRIRGKTERGQPWSE